MERRRVLAAVAGAWAWAWVGAAGLVAGTAQAAEEAFPSKPIQLIIPFGAGGSHDLHARVLASVAPQYLGQPLIVVLRPGGGGAIASQFVARSAPDGYTLLFGGNGPNTILPIVQNVGYGMREFVPVAQINYSPPLLVVRPDAPWKDAREFIEDARQRPNRILFAHTGVYGAAHFPMLLVQEATGVRPVIVGKPSPFIFKLATEDLPTGVRVAMVGDVPEVDILGAHAAGFPGILVAPAPPPLPAP